VRVWFRGAIAARGVECLAGMRFVVWIGSPWLATLGFWLAFGACVDAGVPEPPPAARVVVSWDPRACGPPHRVAVELEDEDGARVSRSVPCELGGLALDAPHWGIYRGRIYAWEAGAIRSVTPVYLAIDEPVVRWFVATPL
jgi:hypothetical protein